MEKGTNLPLQTYGKQPVNPDFALSLDKRESIAQRRSRDRQHNQLIARTVMCLIVAGARVAPNSAVSDCLL